jgi:hypothetical protein
LLKFGEGIIKMKTAQKRQPRGTGAASHMRKFTTAIAIISRMIAVRSVFPGNKLRNIFM